MPGRPAPPRMSTCLGRDGYKRSVPLERVLADGVLATHLNSRPLTLRHGAPWRALLAGLVWNGFGKMAGAHRAGCGAAAARRRHLSAVAPDGFGRTRTATSAANSGQVGDHRSPAGRGAAARETGGSRSRLVGNRQDCERRVHHGRGGPVENGNLQTGSDFGWTAWNGSLELSQSGRCRVRVARD